MGNWKRLFTLLSIILIAFVLLSPILAIAADGPPPNGDGPPPNGDGAPTNGGDGGGPYETPASIYYAIGIVAVIAIVAGVYIWLKK